MKKVVITDRLYGRWEIDSPAILQLMKSRPMQRLKKIAQFGMPYELYHLKGFSRYEHCVGVMLLLRKFGATEEEQIAGLLHDVSHTAFSHLVDWFVGSGEREDFQDKQHKRFIYRSEIKALLQKYNLSPRRITDYHHFSLLEQPLPALCADRLDYSLREFPLSVAKKCLRGLTVEKGKFIFKEKNVALLFGNEYMKKQREHWGGFEAVTRYTILAKTLEYAMKHKIVAFADFWTYDSFIINKLKRSRNIIIQTNLNVLRKKSLAALPRSKKTLRKKFRFIDPDVRVGSKTARLSAIDIHYKKHLTKEKKVNAKGIPQPVLHY